MQPSVVLTTCGNLEWKTAKSQERKPVSSQNRASMIEYAGPGVKVRDKGQLTKAQVPSGCDENTEFQVVLFRHSLLALFCQLNLAS